MPKMAVEGVLIGALVTPKAEMPTGKRRRVVIRIFMMIC